LKKGHIGLSMTTISLEWPCSSHRLKLRTYLESCEQELENGSTIRHTSFLREYRFRA
jgi:hypothetical protein